MQLTYNSDPGMGRAGMLATADIVKRTMSRLARGPIAAGRGVFIVPALGAPGTPPNPNPGTVYQNPSPAAAVDVDAVITTRASAAAGVTVDSTGFNGVAGDGPFYPPRKLTVTTSAHADFDADADGLVITYVNDQGATVSETFATADGGGETFTTTGYAVQPVSYAFAADSMSGAGGSFTAGVAVLDASVTIADFVGVALYDSATVESTYFADTRTEEYVDGATVPLLRVGSVWVTSEDACAEGAPVYMRVGAGAGGSLLGSFRSDADTATAVLVPGARWGRTSLANGLNILELGY